jgi:hypothetical protein
VQSPGDNLSGKHLRRFTGHQHFPGGWNRWNRDDAPGVRHARRLEDESGSLGLSFLPALLNAEAQARGVGKSAGASSE